MATAGRQGSARPMNGEEYLDSLRDGREIWIYGEKVDDVTTHPAFRNGARSVARLYDALHDPATKDVLTVETDTGNGGYTHPFFKAPMSAEDLVRRARRDRRLAAADLRLDGPEPRLQGGVPRHLRAERRLLQAVRGERAPLVQGGAGAGLLHEPHAREPAGRPQQGDPRGRRRLHPRGQGDRRGRRRARRQDGRHRLGVLELQLRLLPRRGADQEGGVRALLLRADEPAGREADLPAVVRVHGGDGRQPVRLPALEPLRRERRRARCSRTR